MPERSVAVIQRSDPAVSDDEMHYLERELREQLRSNPEIFSFLEQGSLDGVWYWDLEEEGHEWLSPRFKEVFGYREDEMEHTPAWWQANIFPEDLALALANFEQHAADPSHPYDQLVRYRHRDGSTVWIRCRGVIIRAEDGTPRRMLGAHQDVTALKRAEQASNAANKLLRKRNDDLERLGYMVSHDLGAPLRGIRGFGDILIEDLEEGAPAEEIRASAERMVKAATRMQSMLDALMGLSRLRGATEVRDRVSLAEVVSAAGADYADALAARGARVEANDLPEVEGNEVQLRSLFSNLIGNAVKYADPERALTILVTAEVGERVAVRVEDTARGFDIALLDRAMTPFVQLQGRNEFSGVGMGLALCREIVDLHGGELEAESEVGRGSTFFFSLPGPSTP